jgi:hypothetical protein
MTFGFRLAHVKPYLYPSAGADPLTSAYHHFTACDHQIIKVSNANKPSLATVNVLKLFSISSKAVTMYEA